MDKRPVIELNDAERVFLNGAQSVSLKNAYPAIASPFSGGGGVEVVLSADKLYFAQEAQITEKFREFCGQVVRVLADKTLLHD